MYSTKHDVCASCGARLNAEAEACDLCGTPRDAEPDVPAAAVEPVSVPAEPLAAAPAAGVFCNRCGWRNPASARFCSVCGGPLEQLNATAPLPSPDAVLPRAPAPAEGRVGRQVGIIVGAGVLLVMALFFITVVSKNRGSAPAAQPQQATAGTGSVVEEHRNLPLPEDLARRADSLQHVIDAATGPAALAARRQMVDLFIGAGRIDRAAIEQARVAELEGTPEAWKRSGDLYFDWMESSQGEHKVEISRLAVEAYQRVLAAQPENLDVRTDLAWAYQYDPARSMEAINQTNLVLEKDANHVRANFNKGVFLIQINRLDQAAAQFERVKQITGRGTTEYERADAAIQAIQDLKSRPNL